MSPWREWRRFEGGEEADRATLIDEVREQMCRRHDCRPQGVDRSEEHLRLRAFMQQG